MRYISIGCACNVKHQIQKHKGACKTLFFDWLITSMDSVISVLNCADIEDILKIGNIVIDSTNPIQNNKSKMLITSLPYCASMHDIGRIVNKKSICDFIDKYTRRFNRLIERIKSNEKIYFIRYNKISEDEKALFIEAILKINPICDFALVNIIIRQSDYNKSRIVKDDYFLEINIPDNKVGDWTTSSFNWKQIFLDIENHI